MTDMDYSAPTVKLRRPKPGIGPAATTPTPCSACGGIVGTDGYCESCGLLAPSPFDHSETSPAPWLAGVCDRGVKHSVNEDAMALWAGHERGVVVVCDGVSSTECADIAARAAATTACEVLSGPTPAAMAVAESESSAMNVLFRTATASANDALINACLDAATGALNLDSMPSCTFAAAVITPQAIWCATLGDTRIYWFGSQSVQLNTDHSVAADLIAGGMGVAEAESAAGSHAITSWLGFDAPDLTPTIIRRQRTEDGWLLVCSDGLWNYASRPETLQSLIDQAIAASGVQPVTPLEVARSLVAWANQQGGRDNITAVLAQVRATVDGAQRKEQDG